MHFACSYSRNDRKLPMPVSVPSATPVWNAFDGIETIEAAADCHICAKVGPAARNFSPFTSLGSRMQPRFETIPPTEPGVRQDNRAGLLA